MTDHDMRTILHDLVGGPEPASTIDITAARRTGKRRLWVRNGGISAAVAAMVALAIVLPQTAFSTAPTSTASGSTTVAPIASGTVNPGTADDFNPLVPYAAFGYIPQGFKIGLDAGDSSTGFTSTANELQATVIEPGTPNSIELDISTEGTCGSTSVYDLNLLPGFHAAHHNTSSCSTSAFAPGHAVRAAAVNGHPAYWFGTYSFGWEYAPDAWAMLSVARGSEKPIPAAEFAKIRAQLPKMADTVKLAQTQPILFPYKLTGAVPATWKVHSVGYTVTSTGQYDAHVLNVGPASSTTFPGMGALSIVDAETPGWGSQTCPTGGSSPTMSSTVQKKDGTSWVIEKLDISATIQKMSQTEPVTPADVKAVEKEAADYGDACTRQPDNGIYAYLFLNNGGLLVRSPSTEPADGIQGILNHLTLNANPRTWTINPLAS